MLVDMHFNCEECIPRMNQDPTGLRCPCNKQFHNTKMSQNSILRGFNCLQNNLTNQIKCRLETSHTMILPPSVNVLFAVIITNPHDRCKQWLMLYSNHGRKVRLNKVSNDNGCSCVI